VTRGAHWFRNDLRLRDNTALEELVSKADAWLPVFILDPSLIAGPRFGAPRTRLLLDCLGRLSRELEKGGVPLIVREGERFFMRHLVDGDPASNSGGRQWAASTGTDAQPYFRIFNPVAQGKRWNPDGRYVRRWIPELRDVPDQHVHAPWGSGQATHYPTPIVDHAERRRIALERYKDARERKVRA